jgi:asparagine synthase (glutamine-hydrolysing)
MCGIVGISGDLSREESLGIVAKMNAAIAHRGPDDEGTWGQDGFAMGMRRLSIIDLSGGHQPMTDDATGRTLVFNGEIYNYRALRAKLERSGDTSWRTKSDTEVVLKGLARNGVGAIKTWNGMFAVASWDPSSQELLLARDRMGVKPLYYYWDGRILLFASEIKAILASGIPPRELDRQAVWDYLTFRYVPGPQSIWRNIRKLPPGHLLRFSPGGEPLEERYWQCEADSGDAVDRSEEVTDREFAELFLDAVDLRLVASDVPVGVFLSGGLDSSAIAAAAVELGHRNFHTFSVGFTEGGYFSELPFARQVAEHVGAHYHDVVLDQKRFLEMLPDVVYATDEPLADMSLVPLLALSRLARERVKVVLSGEGSDEILAGYDFERNMREWDRVRSLQKIPAAMLRTGAALTRIGLPERFHRRASKVAELPLSEWNRQNRPHITYYFDQVEKRRLWPGFDAEDTDRILDGQYRRARSSDPLQQMLSVYQQSWLVEDLLMKADKTTMAASLEARTPFLDYRLVEWANRQPNKVKVAKNRSGNYRTKNVLRRFCERRLPREILERPKRGFPDPANEWLRHGLEKWALDLLTGPGSRSGAVFERSEIRKIVEEARMGLGVAPDRVWTLVMLELWLQTWDVSLS